MKDKFNVAEAYLGLVYSNTKCHWSNGDTSSYKHLCMFRTSIYLHSIFSATSEFCYPTPLRPTVKKTCKIFKLIKKNNYSKNILV